MFSHLQNIQLACNGDDFYTETVRRPLELKSLVVDMIKLIFQLVFIASWQVITPV